MHLAPPALSPPGPPVTLAGTSALKVYPVKDSDPAIAIFAVSHNYVYDTAIVGTDVPYGTKGFVVMRKGGDGAVFKSTQGIDGGWPNHRHLPKLGRLENRRRGRNSNR